MASTEVLFLIQYNTLCLFICMFGTIIINVVINMVGFKCILKLFVPPILYSSFPTFFWIEHFFFSICNITALQYYILFSPSHIVWCCCHIFYFYMCNSFYLRQVDIFEEIFNEEERSYISSALYSFVYIKIFIW